MENVNKYEFKKTFLKFWREIVVVLVAGIIVSRLDVLGIEVDSLMIRDALMALSVGGFTAFMNWLKNRNKGE